MLYEVTVLAKDELELGTLLKKLAIGLKVEKESKPEKKSLAYQINKNSTAVYHFALVEMEGKTVFDLEKKLLSDTRVLRTLIVKKED